MRTKACEHTECEENDSLLLLNQGVLDLKAGISLLLTLDGYSNNISSFICYPHHLKGCKLHLLLATYTQNRNPLKRGNQFISNIYVLEIREY